MPGDQRQHKINKSPMDCEEVPGKYRAVNFAIPRRSKVNFCVWHLPPRNGGVGGGNFHHLRPMT